MYFCVYLSLLVCMDGSRMELALDLGGTKGHLEEGPFSKKYLNFFFLVICGGPCSLPVPPVSSLYGCVCVRT
jgi:hypothetical protein